MVRKVSEGIFEIDTKTLGHEKLVASYLIIGSEKTMLLDPGFPSSVPTVLEEMKKAGVTPDKLDYIAITHSHIDHAGGVGLIAGMAPKARIIAHQRGSFYLKNSAKIAGGSYLVFGEMAKELGMPVDVPAERIELVGDGDIISLGSKKMEVLYTPGHSGDHTSMFERSEGVLFTGDAACLHYPELGNVLVPAGSPPIYRSDFIVEELRRLLALQPRIVLTPHFGESVGDPLDYLEANINAVVETRASIDRMFREGLEFQQVIEKLRKNIISSSGMLESAVSPFLGDTWIRLMLRTGLMGLMADILEYARDLRPFHAYLDEEGSA